MSIERAIGIYELTAGITIYAWLCDRHLAQRKADGWTAKQTKDVDQDCSDCTHAAQPAPPALTFPPPRRVTSEGTESPHEYEPPPQKEKPDATLTLRRDEAIAVGKLAEGSK